MADFDLRRPVNALPVIGPLSEAIFGDPDQEELQRQFKEMQRKYAAYRPEAAQAHMTGLSNQLSLFGPVNAMLGKMYGSGAQFDLSKLLQSPVGAAMLSAGQAPPKPPQAPPMPPSTAPQGAAYGNAVRNGQPPPAPMPQVRR